jgi:hypothetical protein
MKRKKRFGKLPEVPPVTRNDVRYEALHWGRERDLGQNGGYVIAFDDKTGEQLWLQKIYDVVYDGDMEADKQDVFITELALDVSGQELIISNERDRRFSMRLSDRRVMEL